MSEYTYHVAGVPSRLSDRERSLLMRLAIYNLERQFGCTPETAAEALETFTERGEVTIEGDAKDVYLKVVGHPHPRRARLVALGRLPPAGRQQLARCAVHFSQTPESVGSEEPPPCPYLTTCASGARRPGPPATPS